MNNFWQRTLSGILFVIAIIGALAGGPLAFALLFATITGLSLHEFLRMVIPQQPSPARILTVIAGVVIFSLHFLVAGKYMSPSTLGWLLVLPLILWINQMFSNPRNTLTHLAFSLTGLIYPATLISAISYLAYISPDGGGFNRTLLISLFVMIWSHDTLAYLTGKWIGRHKLLPGVSPGKSWEGLAGGLLASLLAAFILYRLQQDMALLHWLMLGLIVTAAGTLGDLSESYVKRSIGIKDSGSLIPGHGGILDRLDAAIFVFPIAWLYLSNVL